MDKLTNLAAIRLFHVTFKTETGREETYPVYDTSLAEAVKHVHQLVPLNITVTHVADPELQIKY